MKRKIVKIDEEKCNGCGQCIPACHEGAIKIIDGKAKLVSDVFCDGLGACLGNCPQGAISIIEREAEAFDEKKAHSQAHAHTCPAAKTIDLSRQTSNLKQWPIQLSLVPTVAPFLSGADILISADCAAFAYADFHKGLLKDKILLIACPKLDDTQAYSEKLIAIFKNNNIKSVTCAHMAVPCCFGLMTIIEEAIAASGKQIPLDEVIISIQGERIK